MKILLTGFEPFGGEKKNASWEAVRQVRAPEGAELFRLQVPVVFGKGTGTVIKKAEELQPDAVLCVGQAGGRRAVTPERIAVNIRSARIPDNEGNQPQEEPIEAGGPDGIFSALPIRAITQVMRDAGISAEISNTAGTFVCNDLMYGVLSWTKKREKQIPAGFVHVPWTSAQAAEMKESVPSMPLEEIVRGLEICLKVIAHESENRKESCVSE